MIVSGMSCACLLNDSCSVLLAHSSRSSMVFMSVQGRTQSA